ncbi:hypothetical protein HanIR_Chr01g0006631 [Helianthus annuus]|nr:hypothetical protein HanIR_Chr01g0006631 [Helianthus annuus]
MTVVISFLCFVFGLPWFRFNRFEFKTWFVLFFFCLRVNSAMRINSLFGQHSASGQHQSTVDSLGQF